MPIIVFCSSCQHPLRVPDDLLGQLVKCPTCGHTFTASAADAAAAPVQQYSAGSPGEKGASYEAPAPQPLAMEGHRYDHLRIGEDFRSRPRHPAAHPTGEFQTIASP